jgi:hypothetical protein
MISFLKSMFYLPAILICVGCVTTRYSHINMLEHNKETKTGKYVDNVWINNSQPALDKNAKIVLEEINIDSISDEKGITKEECKKELKNDILTNEFNKGIINENGIEPNYKMKLIFTNMSPGDAASRVWAAEFGFGHANVEIQAIISNQNQRIIEIKDSRNNSGAIGFRDTFGDASPQLVKEIIKQISDNIIQELNAIFRK